MDELANDWGDLTEADLEELAAPKPQLVTSNQRFIYVAVYMIEGCNLPMTMTCQDRADVIKWVRSSAGLDKSRPFKLYRLEA